MNWYLRACVETNVAAKWNVSECANGRHKGRQALLIRVDETRQTDPGRGVRIRFLAGG